MARMVCKRAFFPAPVSGPQAAVEVPAFEDWSAAPAGPAASPGPAQTRAGDGGWLASSRDLSAGLGCSEVRWSDGPFGDPAQDGE